MALLTVNNLSKFYAENKIFAGVSLQVHQGDKLGLVGPNGSGKTTLFKIIMGLEEPDEGQVFLTKASSLGYLSQKAELLPQMTLKDFLQNAVRDILQLRQEIQALEAQMANPAGKDAAGLASLIEKYGRLSQCYELKNGYTVENRLKLVSGGMGFSAEDMDRPLEDFSGGEKTRAQLAALLLTQPDLLLLDEPTNHLDIDAVEWLEGYLRDWKGALIVVSHDRYFLDRTVTRIAALENRNVTLYKGNYSAYFAQKQIIDAGQEKAYKKQQAALKKDLDLIRTSKADERSKRQARSREKRVEKLEMNVAPGQEKGMTLHFGFTGRSGKIVVGFEKVAKSFGELEVFTGASFEIRWGDRVALVGPNGAGKTTLLRIITGEEIEDKGRVKVGPSVRAAYFDQEQEQLDFSSTPLKVIMEEGGFKETEARKYLGRYLFREEEVFKEVATLSGGEKSRLALARVALTEGNFLILDEPTNHLDIKGVEELEAALAQYPGTLLVVSHDRYFISRTATKVLEVRDGCVTMFKGTYAEYEEAREGAKERETELGYSKEKLSRYQQRERDKEERQKILEARRQRRQLEKRLVQLEGQIQAEEEAVSRFEEKLASPKIYNNFSEARQVTEEFTAAREKVKELYRAWEETGLLLEAILPVEGE